jgi:hypothetical protein
MIVEHFGWPDHHPPPFEYIELILSSIHAHLISDEKATAVIHCKGCALLRRGLMVAGKGRSGTISMSYLITYASWSSDKAFQYFTARRMRYGEGISIPSQRRWVRYVELWSKQLQKKYSVGSVEVTRVQFWGMKLENGDDDIEVGIAGYVEGDYSGSKAVNKIHVFKDDEVSSFQNLC